MKDLLKSPKNLKKTLFYSATQSQLSCKPNSNLAHQWTPKKKKKKKNNFSRRSKKWHVN